MPGYFGPARPSTDYIPVPTDIYEVAILSGELVENQFYNPAKDNPNKSHQIWWTLGLRPSEIPKETEEMQAEEPPQKWTTRFSYYTGCVISKGAKGRRPKLVEFLEMVDPSFSDDVGYPGADAEEAFENMLLAAIDVPLRASVKVTPKKDGTGSYDKVTGLLPSKKGAVTLAELIEMKGEVLEEKDF